MNLTEFVKDKDFKTGSGLPEGDTEINLVKDSIEEVQHKEYGLRYKITQKDKEYLVPKTVMNGLQKVIEEGFLKARVTRSGLTLNDTSYTVVGLKE